MLNSLGKFELARRLLNHDAVVPLTAPYFLTMGDFNTSPSIMIDSLAAYAKDLRAALATETVEGFPDPVLPVIDIANLTVSHTTCTRNTTISVNHRGEFRWCRSHAAPTSNNGLRDRLLASLEDLFCDYESADPAWRIFLDLEDCEAIGFAPMDPATRLVSRSPGVYALYRIGLEDRLYTVDGVVSDYDAMPEDGDAWMPAISSELRAKIFADFPDSVLVEG